MEINEKDLKEIENKIAFLEKKFNLSEAKKKVEELQKQVEVPDFWNNPDNAKDVSQELKEIKEDVEVIDYFKKEITDLQEFFQILEDENDLEEEFNERFLKLKKTVFKKEIELNFIGKYDNLNAVFTIMAGAGGKEAEDWAFMLLHMYQKYFEKKGFSAIILDELLGEGNEGIKTVAIEVRGKYAYGYLRRESGVHRLVRLSPFSAQNLRHTSFALVDVLPVIKESESVKINPEDLRVDYFRASGPGGQYVNTRDSAVRITHIPTGIAVSCQVERSQLSNKEKAMSMLLSKLHMLEEQKRKEEIAKEKGEKVSAGWGNQIRSYVLQPYRMVKDLRTRVETSNTDAVLNGDIDKFIEEEIRVLD